MSNTIYLASGAGEAEIKSALSSLEKSGGTLVFPKDADITLSKTLFVSIGSKDVTIDMNGSTIHQNGNTGTFVATGVENPLQSVKLGVDASSNTTITYDKLPANLQVGSYVKVTADNALPGDHIDATDGGRATLLGQAAKVVAINGNTVVLEEQILEQGQYQTNVRATVYSDGQFTLKNGTIDGSATDFKTVNFDLVHVRNLTGAVVENVTFSDANTGVNFVNSVNSLAKDIIATNVWAGVHSSTSLDTVVDGMFAEHVAHGVLIHGTGTVANAASASSYGADIGLVGRNLVVYDAQMAAYDFHSESRNGTYTDSLAFNSRMFGDFRGIGNTFENSGGVGNAYGIQFYEYGNGDGRDSTVSNMVLRETTNYTFMISNLPQANLVLNSVFESYGSGYSMRKDIVDLINTVIRTKVAGDDDTMVGTDRADMLLGGRGVDTINGGGGNDYIWGGERADVLTGGAGHDRFAYHSISEGGDRITDFKAGVNGDVIDVSVLAARLGWGNGDAIADGHVRIVQSGANSLFQVRDGSAWSTLATLENVRASSFDSHNLQTSLSDTTAWIGTEPVVETQPRPAQDPVIVVTPKEFVGSAGADWFRADGVASLFKGSAGNDSYVFDGVDDKVVGEVAGGGVDTIYASVGVDLRQHDHVENLRLYDDAGAASAAGNDLANLITGNVHSNLIVGGAGNDSLYGKGGADTFVFAESGSANKDSIWDFDADDKILLSRSVFAGLDADNDGVLDAAAFTIALKWGASATGTGPQIVYNSASGMISYDADGAGRGVAQDIVSIGANKTFFDFNDILLA